MMTLAAFLSLLATLLSTINLVIWVTYIVVVSIIVKYVYTDKHPTKAKPITSAVIGTIIGSVFNYALGLGGSMFAVSGVVMAVIGTIIFIRAYERRNNHER